MNPRPITFKVQSNRAKSSFWYTLVSGNGNTTMTSKAKYSTHDTAKRAAQRQIKALQSSQLVLEYTDSAGQTHREAEEVVVSAQSVGVAMTAVHPRDLVEPSTRPAQARMNPQP